MPSPATMPSLLESSPSAASSPRTIGPGGKLWGWRCPLAAFALVAFEAVLAFAGAPSPLLSVAVLLIAPGVVLAPLLPARLDSVVGRLAAAPALGFAATSVALISVARVGIEINGVSSRVTVATIVVAGGLGLGGRRGAREREARVEVEWAEAAGLLGALVVGVVLAARVIGGSPIPGNDWAKYVLYADEIRRQGSLLIDNPYWMLGVPFREDPGAPSVYGAFLTMTGAPATAVMHGIALFSAAGTCAMFALVRAFWGARAAVLAAFLAASLPITQDILGWHGLANVAALALLALVLLYATTLMIDGLGALEAAGFGLILVALAATHRLSLSLGLGVVGVVAVGGVVRGERRRTARGLGLTAVALLAIGPAVASDLLERQRSFGGTQPYTAYLSTKLDLLALAQDLTIPFGAVALLALGLVAARRIRGPALLPLLIGIALTIGGAYAWLVHIPLAYLRMAYFLPLFLVPLVAVAIDRIPRARARVGAGAALTLLVAAFAWVQAPNVKRLYGFTNATSLRGLDALAAQIEPNEVVATDRCWSFLTTWLLHTRTLPALDTADIQPAAELRVARRARAVLDGTPAGLGDRRRLGVRWAVVDPTCKSSAKRPLPPPAGVPAYISRRLVIIDLSRGP